MKNPNKIKHLYIPIEIKVREFDAKLLFALFAAENGFRVILGGQKDLRKRVAWLPAGIYLDKSAAATKIKWFKYFNKLGHMMTAWDEEGLVIHEDSYVDRRLSVKSFELLANFFAWGDFQANVIQSRIGAAEKIRVCGNPRMDMLRPELRNFHKDAVSGIRKDYGRFLLINTNFSFYNHIISKEESRVRFLKNHPEMDESFIDSWIQYQKNLFDSFVDLVPQLEERFPDHSIILRPHPAENHQVWQDITRKFHNVQVVHKNNVIEWILAADAVIHSNCSTGIESFLLDVPVIAYRPVTSEEFDTYLPNVLSEQAGDAAEVCDLISIALSENGGKEKDIEKIRQAKKHIAAIDDKFACENVIENLQYLNAVESSTELSLPEKISRCRIETIPFAKRIFNSLKDNSGMLSCIKGKTGAIDSVADVQRKVHQQTIPDITHLEIQVVAEKLRSCLRRFHDVEIHEVGGGCFEISTEDYVQRS